MVHVRADKSVWKTRVDGTPAVIAADVLEKHAGGGYKRAFRFPFPSRISPRFGFPVETVSRPTRAGSLNPTGEPEAAVQETTGYGATCSTRINN